MSSTRIPLYQDPDEIRRQCLRSGTLFEDPEFEAVDESLFFSRKPPRPFVWKRPKDIVDKPVLFKGAPTRFDIDQGMLGDCWLLAAMAALTGHASLLYQVLDPDQSFDGSDYCGMFKFRFWLYGEWKTVVVDDRLPTYNNKVVFLHSSDNDIFWSALFEKAYAKVSGTYEALKGGQTSEAMTDFTGGITETFDLKKPPKDFFKILLKAQARQALMCCSIEAKPNEIEAKLDNGLIKGHAYAVTNVQKVSARSRSGEQDVELVRVRNPWGNEREWKGAWSDGSREWGLLSDAEKKSIGLTYDDDGEFWMSLMDFMKNFTRLEVCNLSADAAEEPNQRDKWTSATHKGQWVRHVSAGGCRNFPDTFHTNPQFRVNIEPVEDGQGTMVIGLIQMGRRALKSAGQHNLTIGFAIYNLDDDDGDDHAAEKGPMPKDYFLYHKSTARSSSFLNEREVTGRFTLDAGHYLILPSTFKNDEEGTFILRVYCNQETNDSADMAGETRMTPAARRNRAPLSADENKAFDAKFRSFFEKLAGADEEIDSFELQELLNMALKKDMHGKEISLNCARTAISYFDRDRSGKLGYEEFKQMWLMTNKLKAIFSDYDKDSSGDMDLIELRGALDKYGMRLSTWMLSTVGMYYANKKGTINMDDFFAIVFRLASLLEHYNSHVDGKASATFTKDERDRSGKLGYEEFKQMWLMTNKLKAIFSDYDKDRSGDMDLIELRSALEKYGMRLSTWMLSTVGMYYANKKGTINMDDFFAIVFRLASLLEHYNSHVDGKPTATFTKDEVYGLTGAHTCTCRGDLTDMLGSRLLLYINVFRHDGVDGYQYEWEPCYGCTDLDIGQYIYKHGMCAIMKNTHSK